MTGSSRPAPRRVLMLQGPPGRFWSDLAPALTEAGAEVHHMRLCTADALFFRAAPGVHLHAHRGGPESFAARIGGFLDEHGITDVLSYSDRHPYHRAAAAAAEARGARAWAVEFGYLRPDWITFERGGMGAWSRFPTDPAAIRALAERFHPEPLDLAPRFRHGFASEAVNEVLFNLANALFFWPYPGYRAEAYYHPVSEYLSWAARLPFAARRERAAAEAARRAAQGRYFLVALQLESDRQIRDNSAWEGQREMVETLLESFAAHAHESDRLLFKTHPLDNGLEGWPKTVARIAAETGISGRVEVLQGGPLDLLIRGAQGVVATNSTVGLHAIAAGRPMLATGTAIYDLPGLTHQGPMGRFWRAPGAPDPGFADAFMRALAGTIQVRGSFYAPEGRRAAAREIAARLTAAECPGDAAALPVPPRLAAHAALKA
ncbi:capsule biosynthesis protein [Rhodovulum sp. DZ06]|uniref:capsular polysaccharide export protein, LipB/KpsS family n=1 Tax=Rhodovulum sp. DZ06 TaxID=3425126 RepID=UPI003D3283DD